MFLDNFNWSISYNVIGSSFTTIETASIKPALNTPNIKNNMKVNLTYIKNEEKTSKAGKKYTTCSIKTKEKPDLWINGFGNAQTKEWEDKKMALGKDGTLEVELEIFKEEGCVICNPRPLIIRST